MTKKLDETTLGNELKASSFFMAAKSSDSPTPPKAAEPKPSLPKKAPEASETVPSEPEATKIVKVRKIDSSPILGRPKAFYITEEQDRDLDTLVAEISLRLAGRLNFKVDRSIVVRLILESSNLTSNQTTNRLSDELVSRTVTRLTG